MARSIYSKFGTTSTSGIERDDRKHIVGPGDTLPIIAAEYYNGFGYDSELWRLIAEENNIEDLDDIFIGQTIIIPPIRSST